QLFLRLLLRATHTTPLYPLSLHDALPIYRQAQHTGQVLLDEVGHLGVAAAGQAAAAAIEVGYDAARLDRHADVALDGEVLVQDRSEEHTSELQSRFDLVCRLLLEKKKKSI